MCFGVSKVAGGVAGLLLVRHAGRRRMAGMAIGACCGAVLGWLACGRPGRPARRARAGAAMVRAAGALLGFVVLLNLDLLLARHYLPGRVAGEYAVATLFAKIAFWLPQGVGVVLLPRLADPAERRRALPSALAVVAGRRRAADPRARRPSGPARYPWSAERPTAPRSARPAGCSRRWAPCSRWPSCCVYSGIAAADRVAVVVVWAAAAGECLVVAVLAAAGALSVIALALTALGMAGVTVVVGLARALPRGASAARTAQE